MSDYREDCINRKLVQRGIVDQRPVSTNKPKAKENWLIVYFSYNSRRWSVWKGTGYRTENDARKVLSKIHFYSPFVVERHIFEQYYKGYRLEAKDKLSFREIFECRGIVINED